MRWRILKTLLHKEALRHATNRGGLVLAGLLVTASLLLAVLNPAADADKPAPLIGGVHHCIVSFDENSDWIAHLQKSVPPGLSDNILFHWASDQTRYESGIGGIEIRRVREAPPPTFNIDVPNFRITVHYPDSERAGMTVYERWFWRETYRYFYARATEAVRDRRSPFIFPSVNVDDDLWAQQQAFRELENRFTQSGNVFKDTVPHLELHEQPVVGGALDLRAAIATALVLFSLCFTCVYLMPSLTCEERERGLLLAQALSPASSAEILGAKFLFYPAFGIVLATLLAGIHNSAVLTRPFFWMSLATLAVGTLGIGMTIACLAKTQRAASLGALCYMLAIALVLLLCQQNNFTLLPKLALEYHAPHILHATLTNQLRPEHWWNLGASAVLACGWALAAVVLFRRRGWQ